MEKYHGISWKNIEKYHGISWKNIEKYHGKKSKKENKNLSLTFEIFKEKVVTTWCKTVFFFVFLKKMLEEHIAVAHTTARNVSSLSHIPTKDFLKKKREKREKRHIATHTKINVS